MTYQPKYATEEDIEREVMFDITNSTSPNSEQLLEYIEDVEKEVDSLKLGWKKGGSQGDGYNATKYFDVPETTEKLTPLEREHTRATKKRVYIEGYPVLSVSSLERRTSDIEDTPVWETLDRGYYEGWTEASGTHWRLITKKGKCNQEYGIGFYFYKKPPKVGLARLKATFSYSYNLPEEILREWVTLKVSLRVMKAVVTSGEPTRIAGWTGGDFQEYVNTELDTQLEEWKECIAEIENRYFPDGLSGAPALLP